jgi:hypothetical protein
MESEYAKLYSAHSVAVGVECDPGDTDGEAALAEIVGAAFFAYALQLG